MRISDWSSDVCSSDLIFKLARVEACRLRRGMDRHILQNSCPAYFRVLGCKTDEGYNAGPMIAQAFFHCIVDQLRLFQQQRHLVGIGATQRSEERRVGKEGVSTSRSRGSRDH